MDTDRRGFLRAVAASIALLAGPSAAAPTRVQLAETRIHRATRNTRLGTIGERVRPKGRRRPFKSYPEARRFELPDAPARGERALSKVARSIATRRESAGRPLDRTQLARLLFLANGVTSPPRRAGGWELRAAPSAGALYSGEVYVAVRRVAGLPTGFYYYSVREHELVALEGSIGDLSAAFESGAGVENAAAVVLLSNVFERYSWRYANRAYRYALIDSGHIGENLRLAAESAGICERGVLRFHDDRLNAQLGLDGRREAVCAVHALGSEIVESGRLSGDPVRHLMEQQRNTAFVAPRGSVPERFHEATKLVSGLEPESELPKLRADGEDHGREWVRLPRSDAPPDLSVDAAIRARRSAADFSSGSVSLAQLDFVLEMARGLPALERAVGIDLLLVVHRVAELPPGLYRYRAEESALQTLRRTDLRLDFERVCLGQDMARSAAVGCLMVARRVPSTSSLGDRRYRDMLLESGAVAQRIYLAVEALGLAARNLAAFRDDALARLLGLDERGEAALHLTMFGPGD